MRHERNAHLRSSLALIAAILAPSSLATQQPSGNAPARTPHGWEISALPALNFDADEGFGYGAIVEMYDYGSGVQPYRITVQPTLFLTTKGRRDITLFVDSPSLLPAGWRASGFLGREQQLAQPYYGSGNESVHDESLELDGNPYYYRFGRTRLRATADFQHRLGGSAARLLIGGGFSRVTVDPTPFDSGMTLLATSMGGSAPPASRGNYARVGLIYDTRDREIGPTAGTWAEALVQATSKRLGATENYTRWTVSVRRYTPITGRLTYAQRLLAQGTTGNVPFHELATIQGSYKSQDGLGGSSSIRGLPKDRYVGKAAVLSNSELRWRAADFALLGRPSYLVLSSFVDAGRVWSDEMKADEALLLRGLHAGYGGGARVGFGPSFIVALDVGHSNQATAPIYIGLGYLF
jgi:hypothetical protein